jgi:inhibitor of KinA
MTDVRIVTAGDAALVAEFDDRIDADVNARAIALADVLRQSPCSGVRDIVPTFRSVAVYFDPLATDVDRLARTVREAAASATEGRRSAVAACVDVPVCYDPVFGPDLDGVARFGGLEPDAVVAVHGAREYRVFMVGFLPGFAYLGKVDARIAAPRRRSPRLNVPAGSVAIAGELTGIYPCDAPGGWNLVGRTPLRLARIDRPRPTLLQAGDTVRFRPIDRDEFDRIAARQEETT